MTRDGSLLMNESATGSVARRATVASVTVVILHLDATDALRACLHSCARMTYGRYELMVVANGSRVPPKEADLCAVAGRPVIVLHSPVNCGFAAGINLGIRSALSRGAEYVLLLNDDTEVTADLLDRLVAATESDRRLGAVGPAIYYFDEPAKIWFAGATFDAATCTVHFPHADEKGELADPLVPSEWLSGCCLLMTRTALERAGLLDERFFLYWEDADWGLRVRAAGLSLAVVTDAKIYHKVSVSAGGNDSPRKAYHKIRSHLAFARI